jgi:cytochrome P450
VTAKAEVGGVTIPEGARLFLLYGSGNRDESEYTDAERFDIHRKVGAPHLAFSKGIHYCVGNALARLEGRVAFELLLRRLPGLRRHPTLKSVRRPYLILRGFEHLPVQWDASDGA